ncbi:MAG: TrmB family transcriptional regulator [Candidatus Heimdallarchaeota archaeon]|nr:TrmB family transcriptional regulator [Candidatus Heimdallarchaeota archaeon]
MSQIDEIVENLVKLGWSEYESKTYTALTLQGMATASQIAKKADVPTNRVYQVLEKLIEKGYVERISAIGLTTRYKSLDIEKALNNEIEETNELYQSAISSLALLKERQDIKDELRTYTIYGDKELSNQLLRIIERGEKQIDFYVDTLVELRSGNLVQVINTKVETNLDLEFKLMTSPRGINDSYEREVYEALEDVEVRITSDALSTVLIIVDQKEMIFVSFAQLTDESTPRDYFGVHLVDQKTIRMFQRLFNLSWESATFAPEK